MATRYTVYYAGQIIEGHAAPAVRSGLATLFNADEATLDKLFSGKVQILKRDCDASTAGKYQQAMARVGAHAIIKAVEPAASAAAPADNTDAVRRQSAAERIAALAAAEDDTRFRSDARPAAAPKPAKDEKFQLAPVGADLLRPEERRPADPPAPISSSLSVDNDATRLSAEPAAAPPPPDTSHIALDNPGGTIPNLPGAEPLPAPDTSAIDLTPPGTDFSDCAADTPAPPTLDLSELALAPEGSVVLEERFRRHYEGEAPATDHIALADEQTRD
ncbi:MAG: hypothetical protein KDI09_02025 [Halioglobus sp.]|nr:hypothetical protein [Halioglobus sp.]